MNKGRLKKVRALIVAEEFGFDMRKVLYVEYVEGTITNAQDLALRPPCGTIGCVGGHVAILMAREGHTVSECFGEQHEWLGITRRDYNHLVTPDRYSETMLSQDEQRRRAVEQIDNLIDGKPVPEDWLQ